ncbi:MAG: ABC transporter permease [Bacteroidetes bacterium]|nr:ABC transporter permease [Bacteroidota bacterium]
MKTKKIEEHYEIASQYKLMWVKLKRHKLAMIGLAMLVIFYLILMFCEFLSPYQSMTRNTNLIYAPPQRMHFVHEGKFQLRPFVYGYATERDMETLKLHFKADTEKKSDIYLFVKGDTYKLWGLFPGSRHLFGVKEGYFHLFGTDGLGRDMLTRVFYGTRVSLSIGMIGLVMTFFLGLIMGGISGYLGGVYDLVIQRIIEFIRSIPTLPLWMALAAALPSSWPPLRIYFGITIILSVIGWTGLARVIRGKLLSLREEDYVLAAKISGASASVIISRHLIPSFLSYIIVSLTLWVPQMILGETALSFIGLGLRAPVVSWGSLLYEARDIHAIAVAPWLLLPALAIFLTVLAFNFLGDGLRDAADPYKR